MSEQYRRHYQYSYRRNSKHHLYIIYKNESNDHLNFTPLRPIQHLGSYSSNRVKYFFTCINFLLFLLNDNQQYSEIMVWKALKGFIYYFDMFCSTQLLRYKSQTHYKTLTGGLLSLLIVCVIAAGFFNMATDTLKRTQIASSLITTHHLDPPLATLVPGVQNMFMMGLSILSFDLSYQADLNNGPQYFTIMMSIFQFSKGSKQALKRTMVPLEPCTKKHWEMIPQFSKVFDHLGAENWACVPVGFPLAIQGTLLSSINKQISIQVFPCDNITSNNSCASQQQIDLLFQKHQNFYLGLNYVKPVISPIQQEYITYHNEISDYIIFSRTIGSQAWLYFSDYTINTDDSIWPYQNYIIKKGCIAEQKSISHPYVVTPKTPLASVYLAKATNSLTYKREVQKISLVFSYIGGLVGAITAFLFLVKSYTDSSLEVNIGINLFESLKNGNQTQENFHFLSYLRLSFYRIIKSLGWSKVQQYSQRLQRYQEEAVRQMDVEVILKRLIKLQSFIDCHFAPDQLAQIRQSHPITVDNAKKMRSLLLIQQVPSLQEMQKSEGKAEVTIEGQQDISQQQQSKKKTMQDLIQSPKKHPVTIKDKGKCNINPHEKQLNESKCLKTKEEVSISRTNILKRVRVLDNCKKGQENCMEIVSIETTHQKSHNRI